MARLPFPRGGIRTRLPLTIYRRSSDEFSPTEIEGLALWLDASSSDSLYTTDAGPVTAVASPLDIAGCQLWLDASDPAYVTSSGGVVSQWTDKSATGSTWTVPGGDGGPSTGTATINGKNVLVFDGTNDSLSASAPLNTSNPLTMFVVQRISTATLAGMTYTAGTGDLFNIRQAGSTSGFLEIIAGGARVFLGSSARTGINDIVSVTFPAATDDSLYVQGLVQSPLTNAALKPTLTGTHYIGKRSDGFYLNGQIAEIIAYNTALTTAQRASVEAYLATKWGISGVHTPATASSDPVGYWGDKSGNGRHAVMSVSGNRPTISATAQNGRKQLLFDGTNDRLSLSSGLSLGTTGYSVLAVLRHSGGFTVWLEGGSLNPYFSTHPSINTGLYHWDGAVAVEATAALPVGSAAVVSGIISPSSRALYSQSALAVTGAGTSRAATIQNIGATSSGFNWNGNIDELLVYSKVLTTAERQRAERYLAARWGITLAPTVSNADAQDWINRVYANGGTVSSATAAAVNTLCESLESASLRDRFFRLNLFCGNSDAALAAVRTPLFLGPSLGGTQYGNTTDTNNNFLAADYNEASGLQGNGSTKYLNTGVPMNFTNIRDYHLSSYVSSVTSGNPGFIGADTNGDGVSPRFFQALVSFVSTPRIWVWYNYGTTGSQSDNSSNSYAPGLLSGVGSATASSLYVGASSVASAVAQPNETASRTFPIYVFAYNNRNAVVSSYANARLGGYSLGLAMNATQIGQYNTALAAFNSAMGRA